MARGRYERRSAPSTHRAPTVRRVRPEQVAGGVAVALVAVIVASGYAASVVPTIMADDAAAAAAAHSLVGASTSSSAAGAASGATSRASKLSGTGSTATAQASSTTARVVSPAAVQGSSTAGSTAGEPLAAASGATASSPASQHARSAVPAVATATEAATPTADPTTPATAPTVAAAPTVPASDPPAPTVEPASAPVAVPSTPTLAPPQPPVVPSPSAGPVTPSPVPPVTVTTGRAASLAGARLGAASYAVPAGAVVVATDGDDANPGSIAAPVATLARALSIAPSGGTVVVRGGTYHQGNLRIGRTVTIEGYPGETVWFDGARPVSGFGFSGAAWSLAGWTPVFDHSPTYQKGAADGTAAGWQWVNPSYPMAAYPDMVWVGGQPQRQVSSSVAVTAGTFSVDTTAHVLTIGSDPGAGVEASDLQQFAVVSAPGTTSRGLGIRRYADSMPMMGALTVYGAGTTLDQVAVDDNATQGVGIGTTRVTLRHVTALRNGLLGIQAAYADGIVLDGVDAERNNAEHFNAAPNAGGIKIGRSRGVTVRNSTVSGNYGQGFWCDESCYDMTLVGNDVVGNDDVGIFTEISDTGIVADNVVTDNKDDGLRIANTGNLQVWSNTFARNKRDIDITQDWRKQTDLSTPGHDPRQSLPDPTMPWLSANVVVRDNILDTATGNALLGVEDFTLTRSAKQMGISVDANAYARSSAASPAWLVVWSAGSGNGGNPNVFTGLAAFSAFTGQEGSGQETVLPTVDPAQFPQVVPAALPADVAAAASRPGGVPHLGAWT